VPVKSLFANVNSPGVSSSFTGFGVLTLVSRPVDRVLVVSSHDSASSTDSDGSSSSSLGVGSRVDGVPLSDLSEFSLHDITILFGGDEGSFHTDGNVDTSGNSSEGGPSSSGNVVHNMNLSVFTTDNGVSVGINSDFSSSGSTLNDPIVVNAVVDFTVLSSNPDVSLGSDTNISNLAESVGFNLDPFLGVEFVKVSVSGDSPRVAISTSTDSNSLDVVSELLPVVDVHTVPLSVSMLGDLTVLSSNEDVASGVGSDINGRNTSSLLEVNCLEVLASVFHVVGTSGDEVDDRVRSADEGSLLFAVKVVPSSVLLKSKAISSSGRLVSSPVSEGEVSVVVRPSPDLVFVALDGVVVTTDPDFVSLLDILVFLEGVVLVLSEDRGEVPALLFTVGLGIVPVKSELGGEVPDSLLAGFASLGGPCGFTVGGDNVRVSVHADSNTTGSLTVDSVPVVSSGMVSLSFNEFPDSHVFVASGVLSDDHEITGRSSSDVHSSSSELGPLLSVVGVLVRLEDSTVLADNGGLSIVLDGNSVGVTRSVSVNVEFALLEEGDLSSSVDNPDLTVGTGTDINGSH